ncbi:methyl-accepting chemotaxis protein [Clostridium ganghwense]|uniref:Methyl-accepting chemotaxis protein n=1 Tax=Clostridium ganghwense TaxID=312089 RepID=A0ABT4CLF9_9CLOT|nr:methyl-accepting chemotaxis protein [Clostridium ganghwense]MCY6369313.1 methyl-accepting chemotaxis protein [Clostridium ganghwense]
MIKLKIKGKIFSMTAFIITFLLISVFASMFYYINKLVNDNNNKLLDSNGKLMISLLDEKYSGEWRVEGDKLYKGKKLLNEDTEFVDLIKEKTSDEVTIFLNDTRISTTVEEQGKRAVGTKASSEVVQKVLKEGNIYKGQANVLNTLYEVKYAPIKDKNGQNIGMFFIGVDQNTIKKQVNSLMFTIAGITLIVGVLSFIIVVLITKSITNPLNKSVEHLGVISKGDLTVEVSDEVLKRHDEIGDLTRSVKVMQDSVRQMILNIKEVSENIEDSSEDLECSAEATASSSQNVSIAIQDVAKGAGNQSDNLLDITHILNQFGDKLEEMVQAITHTGSTFNEIDFMTSEGNNKMQKLIQSITQVGDSFKNFSDTITGFGENINQINEITAVINNIADQTNLLALNAAIEAASAGESGKGFAVVADEIRKLAEQSKISAGNINKLIDDISSNTGTIISNSDTMNTELNDQVEVINTTINFFKKITKAIEKIVPEIQSVNNLAVNINKEKDTILQKVEEISSVSEEVAASSEEIAASSEEMNASSEELTATVHSLNDMSKEMMNEVNKFKL